MALLELNGVPAWQLMVLGGLFTSARCSHVHGMLTASAGSRAAGALGTVIIMLAMAGQLLLLALTG